MPDTPILCLLTRSNRYYPLMVRQMRGGNSSALGQSLFFVSEPQP